MTARGQAARPEPKAKVPDHTRALAYIAQCDDVEKLRTMRANALKLGAAGVADTALKRLISVAPSEQPGSVEHDFWQMVHALEQFLSEERGKTTKLSRTRQMATRTGVVPTLINLASRDKDTAGFQMLVDRGMPEYTGEAIVLRHAAAFATEVVEVARRRLVEAGVDVSKLPVEQ